MKNCKLKVMLNWALIVTVVFMSIEILFAGAQLADSLLHMEHRDLSTEVSLYGFGIGLISCSRAIVISLLYIVFSIRSIRSLKRDNFFNTRNVYFLACIAGVSFLWALVEGTFATVSMGTLTMAIPRFIGSIGSTAIMLSIALLYLAAVRSEETEKLTI
ncbi:MAG: hypothetical protein K6E73_04460 [Bacteroidales bacterium]|nr:hypothetical protein [Bacteroidales bacterium]